MRVSTHLATINPGTASCARIASRARSNRFGSFTCGTKRNIGAVTTPRPVFDRDATARPFVFNLPSATSRPGIGIYHFRGSRLNACWVCNSLIDVPQRNSPFQ
jgi:hypothetical protein